MIDVNSCIKIPGDQGDRRVLVIGGTGVVGAPIVRQLDSAGWKVHVTSRRATQARAHFGPRVDLVPGDANRVEDLERAMAGCHAVLICVSDLLDPYLDLRVTQNVVGLARGHGIERVVLISGPSVATERRSFPMIDAKFQAEEHLKQSGVPWVIVRPTWPMESLARFVRGSRASVLGRQPATIHPVAGADIGRMVCRALELNEALGHTFTIHGPAASTMKQWLQDYCALTQPR
ncbi:MAG: NAD(P)H-binding protein, partial [Myxococcota bacterium]|nr:NAD(P)H-binding protein [Myxococcota bacterium]